MKSRAEIGLAETDKAEIEYFKFGTGEKVLVLIPGISIKSLVNSANAIAKEYRQFCDGYTVYAILPRRDIPDGVTLFDMADDVASAMKKLGLSNACVMGTSMGGMIAQILAIKYPALVRKLALCSTASRVNGTLSDVMDKFIALAKKNDAVTLCVEFVNYVYSKKFADVFGDFFAQLHKDITEDEMRRFIRLASACKTLNNYDELEKIRCPILVIGAKGDRVLTGEASEEFAEKTGCEIYMYDESFSHAVYDEAKDYKDRILKFFNKE